MDFVAHWGTIFAREQRQPELVGSLHEEALNSFLARHHAEQKGDTPYKFAQDFTFNDGTADRKFTVKLNATEPLVFDLAPISQAEPAGWSRTLGALEDQNPGLGSEANLSARMAMLEVELSWPKLAGGSDHTIALKLDIEGTVRLYLDKNLADNHAIFAELHKVRFTQASVAAATKAIEEAGYATDDKCADLLIIVMNIIANQYGPRVVQAIEMPAPTVGEKIAIPVSFDVSENTITIGFDVDRVTRMREVEEQFDKMLGMYNALLDRDAEAAGGIDAIFFDEHGEPRSDTEVNVRLSHSRGYVRQLEAQLATARNAGDSTLSGTPTSDPTIAMGFNEYAFDLIAQGAIKQSDDSACTRWLTVDPVRGRACHWSRIGRPDVEVGGDAATLKVSGSVHVDFGGKLEACLKRFYRCSSKWDCKSIGLSLTGPGMVKVTSKTTANGLILQAKVDKLPKFKTSGIPWPFSKIIEKVLDLLVDAARIILNLAARFLTIRVVKEVIDVPSSKTDLKLSSFKSHYALIDSGAPSVSPAQKEYAVVLAEATGV